MKTKKNKNFRNKTAKVYSIPSYDKDIVGIIDVNAIRKNINYLKKKSGSDLMPVLKADAYGHGAVEMAKILRSLGIKYIGVATLGEAIMLRDSGDKGRILAWLYDVNGDELKQALHMDIDIAIFDEKTIPKFISLIPKNKKINVTMFVDTGINRAGISYDKAYDSFIEVSKCDNIKIEGMMSHLVSSGVKNSPIVNEQLRKFRDLRKRLSEINIVPPLVHIANTGGCLNYDVSDFTLARPGSGIYGVGGDDKYSKFLSLAMTVKSYIIQIKDVDKGKGIGYDWKYVTPRKMKIAILPIGYADIIPRSTSEKLYVYINGTKRKVLGTISMDQIMVEAKKSDKISDDAIIFGNGVNCPQTIFDIADESDILSLEILCHTGYRINRLYINK
jgi:alanine racemase